MPFDIAISGLQAAQAELNVLGNNIANSATTGFKRSRASFQDVYAVTAGGADGAAGHGVNVGRVSQQFSQGKFSFTDNALDLAVSGQGFFILSAGGERVYSRDGAFGTDRDGYVVNNNGDRLQAFGVDTVGNVNGSLSDLRLSQANNPPVATTAVDLAANLDANATPPSIAVFDPLDPATYNETTALNVFDSQGGSHLMQVYFVRDAAVNTWQARTYVDGVAVSGPDPLVFDGAGRLATPASGDITIPAFTPVAGVNPMNVTMTVGSSTMFGAPFGVNELGQDGFTTGRLASIDIDREGIILARFTNGQINVVGQVGLANFPNPQGLRPTGRNNWAESYAAGQALEGKPGSSSLGLLQGGALEDSNVDLSEELVGLIIAQRNFQANTKVISTADTVSQAVINIR